MCIKDKLYAGFTDVRSRRGRGGVYEYITWKDVANRMNEVFGINWSSEVMYQDVVGNNVVVRVRVMVTNPDDGKMQYQEGFGGAQNDQNAEAGNPFKSAYSKALKDACKKWGVALFIEEDSAPQNMETPPPGYQGLETAPAPPAPPAAPVTEAVPTPPATGGLPTPPGIEMGQPAAPAAPPAPAPAPPAEPTPPAAPAAPVTEQPVPPTAPVPPAPPVQAAPPTPPPAQAAPPAPPAQEVQQPAAPPTPPPAAAAPATPAPTGELPMTNFAMGGTAMISDVQRAALHSILQMQKIEYEALVAEAFQANNIVKSPLPTVDQLTYDEAVHVVKYGNDKFRKR